MESSKNLEAPFICGKCSIVYLEYTNLLEHLFWRHGTESYYCNKCLLKRWEYAAHKCHVLPVEHEVFIKGLYMETDEPPTCPERGSDYCYCGQYIPEASMIGCDGPDCPQQWYHFSCVGITSAPDGDWFCPTCRQLEHRDDMRMK